MKNMMAEFYCWSVKGNLYKTALEAKFIFKWEAYKEISRSEFKYKNNKPNL